MKYSLSNFIFLFVLFIFYSTFAASFTPGKDKYYFSVEYTPSFKDNVQGGRSKEFNQFIEVLNEIGFTKNQSLAFDLFYDRDIALSDVEHNVGYKLKPALISFETSYKINIPITESIDFGIRNSFAMMEGSNGILAERYQLRFMLRHDNKAGFYKHSRLEIGYRRMFTQSSIDKVRIDFRLKLRLREKVDLFIRVLPWLDFARKDFYYKQNSAFQSQTNIMPFQSGFRGLKISQTNIYIGPDFLLSNKQVFSIYAYLRIQAKGSYDRNNKGIMFVYSKTFNLD